MATQDYTVTSENYSDMNLTGSFGIVDGQQFLICNQGSETVYFRSDVSTPNNNLTGVPIKAGDSGVYTKTAGENLYVRKKHSFDSNQHLVIEV